MPTELSNLAATQQNCDAIAELQACKAEMQACIDELKAQSSEPPKVQHTEGRTVISDYNGGWQWGGWTADAAGTTGIIDLGWEEVFSVTAPAFDPAAPITQYDVEINAKFGRFQTQLREANMQNWLGWRVKVNGVVVGTRSTAEFRVRDTRTTLGTEGLATVKSGSADAYHWVRRNVPAGATVSIEHRHRYRVVNVQENPFARVLAGAYADATFDFTPRQIVTDVS